MGCVCAAFLQFWARVPVLIIVALHHTSLPGLLLRQLRAERWLELGRDFLTGARVVVVEFAIVLGTHSFNSTVELSNSFFFVFVGVGRGPAIHALTALAAPQRPPFQKEGSCGARVRVCVHGACSRIECPARVAQWHVIPT